MFLVWGGLVRTPRPPPPTPFLGTANRYYTFWVHWDESSYFDILEEYFNQFMKTYFLRKQKQIQSELGVVHY